MDYSKIAQNLELQIRNHLKDRKAIVGISGGIDSAVVATLCVRALGKDRVFGVLIPHGPQKMKDAYDVVSFLGIKNKEVNIKKIVDDFDFIEFNKVSKGNIMARTRMIVLYSFANELNGMVVGTGNKSELEIGYFTKHGDGGVDLEPIGDLHKTEVWELAKYLEIPKHIIDKKPSADLWEGQTDEGEIGVSYKELDSILKGEINSGEAYEKVQKLISASEHKRHMPPTFKVKNDI
jgi:NAD+ synthase